MKRRAALSGMILFGTMVLVAATSCSDAETPSTTNATTGPNGPSVPVVKEAVIGPSGGVINAEGVTLTIPAGALATDQQIRVTRTNDTAPADITALSPLYRFEPDGLTFTTPAQVTFSFSSPANATTTTIPIFFWSSPTSPRGYEALASHVDGATITAAVGHFSSGFVGAQSENAVVDAGVTGDAVAAQDADATTSDAATDATTAVPDACACALGLSCCAGSCRSLQNDPFNCGVCGKVCPTTSSACINSVCAVPPSG